MNNSHSQDFEDSQNLNIMGNIQGGSMRNHMKFVDRNFRYADKDCRMAKIEEDGKTI